MPGLKASIFILIGLLLCGAAAERLSDSQRAARFISALTETDVKGLENLHSDTQDPELQSRLNSLFKNPPPLPATTPTDVHLLKMDKTRGKDFRETAFHFLLDFPSGTHHLILLVIRHGADGKTGFSVIGKPITPEMLGQGGFVLKGKPAYQLLFLALGFTIAVFVLAMALVCFRMKPKFRWFWICFILVGFFRFDMNWATGRVVFLPFQLLFFGVQATHPAAYSPWIVSISLPAGALFFYWLKLRPLRLARRHDDART